MSVQEAEHISRGIVEMLGGSPLPSKVSEHLDALSGAELRRIVRHGAKAEIIARWVLALCLSRIHGERLWATWRSKNGGRYESFSHWLYEEVGNIDIQTVMRMIWVANAVRKVPEELRVEFFRQSPSRVYETRPIFETKGPESALEYARSDMHRDVMRECVRKEAYGTKEKSDDEMVAMRFLVTRSVQREFMGAVNIAKSMMGKPHVTDSEALMAIGVDFLANVDRSSPTFEVAYAGKLKCISCGVLYPVQKHHVIPRSHNIEKPDGGGKWDPDDPEWPVVYLCDMHHRNVTQNSGGTWRSYAARWMAVDGELKRKVERFLGGRSLDEI